MTVCNVRSPYIKPDRTHRSSDNMTLLADYNSKLNVSFEHTRCPHHVDKHNVIKTPFILLLVGCWTTTSWRNYHQVFSVTTPSWYRCKFGVCLIYVRNALNPSRIDKNNNRYEQRCLSSKRNQLQSRNVLFL